MDKKILFGLVCGFFLAQGLVAHAATYYVAKTSCSDSYAGTLAQPWCTITKAANTMVAGDTTYVRSGIYQEMLEPANSGTAAKPITYAAYAGEAPIIDGNNGKLAVWTLVALGADYINISGFEIRYSPGNGIYIGGNHNTISNCNIHHSYYSGVLLEQDTGKVASYNTVQNCTVWQNSQVNLNGILNTTGGSWGGGLSSGANSQHTLFHGNTVYQNWGEGILSYLSDNNTIENNTSYDNWATQIYLESTTYSVAQNNLVYETASPISHTNSGSGFGIQMADESSPARSSNNTVINNLVANCEINFVWNQLVSDSKLVNALIANNDFINSQNSQTWNVYIGTGSHTNNQFKNNIIEQDNSTAIATLPASGIAYSNNDWSSNPPSVASSSTNVIGDPKLTKTGTFTSASYFNLQSTSPAIDKAVVLSGVTTDYAGTARGSSPDIGAFEYAGSSSCTSQCTSGATQCSGTNIQTCSDTNGDGCTEWGTAVACSTGYTCSAGNCVSSCTPSCSGKTCGSDGCGGTCGTCAAGYTCNASGTCIASVSGPALNFVSPTDASGATITRTYTQPSVNATTSSLNTFSFNWNGTSYPIYDSSLVLGLNFNNNSSIGESSTKFIDISKNANNGTCSGTACPNYTSSGKFGGAYTFNGSSEYVTCGAAASLNPTSALTIEAWIKPSSLSGERAIVHKENWAKKTGYYLETIGNKVEFTIGNGSNNAGVNGATSLSTGNWYHIAGVLNNGTMTVYVNGKSDGSATGNGTIKSGSEVLTIGKVAAMSTQYFNGTVDEVRIYNRALTAAEIALQYQSEFKKVTASGWQFSDTVSGLANGNYSYSAAATDAGNNTGSTETRTLTVNTGTASSSSAQTVASVALAGTADPAAPTAVVPSQTQNSSSIQEQIGFIQQRIRELMASIQASIALGLIR